MTMRPSKHNVVWTTPSQDAAGRAPCHTRRLNEIRRDNVLINRNIIKESVAHIVIHLFLKQKEYDHDCPTGNTV
jgi:hypothetical protein